MKRVAISEARDRLSTLINEVAHGKGRVVLESHGRPKAALVCMEDLQRLMPEARGPGDPEEEMMLWLEQTELMLARPERGEASLAALYDVREESVAEDPGVYRRERSPKAGGRRKR